MSWKANPSFDFAAFGQEIAMSTQPVSNSLIQELQSFYQNRAADLKQL
jgi:hypothetical protein